MAIRISIFVFSKTGQSRTQNTNFTAYNTTVRSNIKSVAFMSIKEEDKIRLDYTPQLLQRNSCVLMNPPEQASSLTGLSALLRNAMPMFTRMNPVGSILGRRHRGVGLNMDTV